MLLECLVSCFWLFYLLKEIFYWIVYVLFFIHLRLTDFCLDEISFRRDYKSCQIGVVDVRSLFVRPTFMETLRLGNFCNFGATLLGFGTVFTNGEPHEFAGRRSQKMAFSKKHF